MASALAAGSMTLQDFASQLGPDGTLLPYTDFTTQQNGLLTKLMFRDGNLPDGDLVEYLSGSTSGEAAQFAQINKGVVGNKAVFTSAQYKCGMLNEKFDIPLLLQKNFGNSVFASEIDRQRKFAMGKMKRNAVGAMLYGNSATTPASIDGLATLYSATSVAGFGSNIILGGGTTSNQTSIWLLHSGDLECGVTGIIPKNGEMGLTNALANVNGITEITDADNGGTYQGYREYLYWNIGITVPDPRKNVRIANVDIAGIASTDLFALMLKAIYTLPADVDMNKLFFIAPRIAFMHLDALATSKVSTGGGLTFQNYQGQMVLSFRGIPIFREDQILETESVVA